MHAVMRDYSGSGAKKFFDLLENKKAEVKDVMMPIRGFVSYSLVRTARGGFSVTICQDKAGTDESVRVAREWIASRRYSRGNAEDLGRRSHPASLTLAGCTFVNRTPSLATARRSTDTQLPILFAAR